MRRTAHLLAVAALAVCLLPSRVPAQSGGPLPHAWLFGIWTGGLFPATASENTAACLAQPVVIFTRDVVLRATLMDVTFQQHVVATARTKGSDTEFTFAPAAPAPSQVPGGVSAEAAGFGCDSPESLHVHRRSENEITFPNCADFPNPLIRCTPH